MRQNSLSADAEAVVFVALAFSAAIRYWLTTMPLMLHRREFGTDQFSVHDGELYVGRIYKTRMGNWYWGLDQFSAGSMNGHAETPDEAMTALVSAWNAATGETQPTA